MIKEVEKRILSSLILIPLAIFFIIQGSVFFAFFPVSAKRKDLINDDLEYNLKITNKSVTQPNLKKMLSRQNYNLAIQNYQKTNDSTSLSIKVNSFKMIIKNIFYFIYVIFKLFILEILFFPIYVANYFFKIKFICPKKTIFIKISWVSKF